MRLKILVSVVFMSLAGVAAHAYHQKAEQEREAREEAEMIAMLEKAMGVQLTKPLPDGEYLGVYEGTDGNCPKSWGNVAGYDIGTLGLFAVKDGKIPGFACDWSGEKMHCTREERVRKPCKMRAVTALLVHEVTPEKYRVERYKHFDPDNPDRCSRCVSVSSIEFRKQ